MRRNQNKQNKNARMVKMQLADKVDQDQKVPLPKLTKVLLVILGVVCLIGIFRAASFAYIAYNQEIAQYYTLRDFNIVSMEDAKSVHWILCCISIVTGSIGLALLLPKKRLLRRARDDNHGKHHKNETNESPPDNNGSNSTISE